MIKLDVTWQQIKKKKRAATAALSYSLRWGHALLSTSTLPEPVKT